MICKEDKKDGVRGLIGLKKIIMSREEKVLVKRR
jgi:hypothetical protein